MQQLISGEERETVDFASFESYWGHGQQYMSVVRTIDIK
tara:strand:+ start:2034 stop:2150 length:117 start_codon:yes stop_codon:yes gene_type:complete